MKPDNVFVPKSRKKVLISNDFREILITQNTSIIEQRIIVMILSAIKEQQSLFINVKSFDNKREFQLSIDDYHQGWTNQSIVEFAKEADIKVIAEYVSSKEIFEIVKILGIDYAQGYYFSIPEEI